MTSPCPHNIKFFRLVSVQNFGFYTSFTKFTSPSLGNGAKREELPVTKGSMESVDMHIDEPQQAEPEEDLDISEFREDKPQNIS